MKQRIKEETGTIRKLTLDAHCNNLRAFLTRNGHTSDEFYRCDRIRGPGSETWIDNEFPCTCGFDEAHDALDNITIEILRDSAGK